MRAKPTAPFLSAVLASILLALAFVGYVEGTTLNFDALTGFGFETPAAPYLDEFGIVISNVLGGTVVIRQDPNSEPTSSPNVLTLSGGNNHPVSFTLILPASAASVSFNRSGTKGDALHPTWSATALDAAMQPIATVSEDFTVNEPAQSFTLSGPGIKAIRFDSDNGGFAAFTAALLDDLVITPEDALACVPDSRIANVLLPEFIVPVQWDFKLWQIRYGNLGLDFTIVESPFTNVVCEAQSNTGSLSVSTTFLTTGHEIPIAVRSVASATVSLFEPASLGPLMTCDWDAALVNGCLLNGLFNINASYVRWHSEGFVTQVFGLEPVATGPLTFFVDLAQLSLSPSSNSFDEILRAVERNIHVVLINRLPAVVNYAVIQDPGSVMLRVANNDGLVTGQLADGTALTNIPGSFLLDSSEYPAVILVNEVDGSYRITVTGRESGPFLLSVGSANLLTHTTAQTVAEGEITTGVSLVYSATISTEDGELRHEATTDPRASAQLLANRVRSTVHGPARLALLATLRAADALIERGSFNKAQLILRAFILEVTALTGKSVSRESAALLKSWADAIISQLQ
jgi:hypothetical protein